MPDLLEVITENDTAVLNGWARGFNENATRIEALPQDKRRGELLTLAREFTRRASWATDTAEGWLTELMTRLGTGMGGDKYRALLRSGRELCRMCQSVAEMASDLWRLAEAAGAPADEVRDANGVLTTVRQRLTAVENTIVPLLRRSERPWPEIDEARWEKGKQQIAEGKGLTLDQARAAIRNSE